jgi:hypothetical protein
MQVPDEVAEDAAAAADATFAKDDGDVNAAELPADDAA